MDLIALGFIGIVYFMSGRNLNLLHAKIMNMVLCAHYRQLLIYETLKKVWSHEFLKIFHIREDLMKKAGNISRKNLLSMGTCFGKMTKTGKFHLQITALDFMAPYAKVSKVL